MTGSGLPMHFVLSKFTLALLQDSGWYQVDYSLAEPFTWGKNQGCGFLNLACKDKIKHSEFCYPDDPIDGCKI